MADGSVDLKRAARDAAYATPLEALNPAQPDLFANDAHWAVFERLRAKSPVHHTPRERLRPLLVGQPLPRHHGGRHQPPGVLVRGRDNTLQSLESKAEMAKRPAAPELHLDGPAQARRAAQDSSPRRRARPIRRQSHCHPCAPWINRHAEYRISCVKKFRLRLGERKILVLENPAFNLWLITVLSAVLLKR